MPTDDLRDRLEARVEHWFNLPDDLAPNDEMSRQVTDVVMAEVSPVLERLRGELAETREQLRLTDAMRQQNLDAAAAALQRAEQAEAEAAQLRVFVERMPDQHMRFGIVGQDATEMVCADWCYACKLERAEAERAALKDEVAEQTQRTLNAAADKLYALPATDGAALKGPYWYRQGFTQAADLLRDWADYPAALAVPETAEKPQKPARKVPDRIDYDTAGELDDVVVNDCMAHLERLDTGRWYLGLYGNDGRILQIDIASKTGRAAVTGFVKYSEGIEDVPESNEDAPTGETDHASRESRLEAMTNPNRVPVTVLINVGDQAELLTPDHDLDNPLRIPAATIAQDAGLPANELPGRRFTALRDGDTFRDFELVDDPRL